jgi:Family of unknown function (DUF5412)
MKSRIYVIVCTLFLGCCSFSLTGDCNNTIKSEVKSPDEKYVATLYVRDCGATTDFSTIVSLRAGSANFNGEEGRIFVIKGQPQVNILWTDKTSLRIECIKCSPDEIFKKEKSWEDINVSY